MIRVAEEQDVEGVVATLVGAFYDDPLWSWGFPEPSRRRAQHEAAFRALVMSAVARRWVWTTDGYGAASVWIPPGEPELTDDEATAFAALLAQVAPDRTNEIASLFASFEASHPRGEPHFYLSLLGTDPARRGEGLGMGLLSANLERIDALGFPAYLESSNPVNVARYESVGFEVLFERVVTPEGHGFAGMWRAPRT